MESYETIEHDVLVIGAGGAGLRAAIAAAEAGLSVGVVCKSLLGKAHTVMAEGGIAGALANLDKKDSWQVHFMDTMQRRAVPQQLAHRRDPGERGAGARAGAGAVWRGLRPHARRPDHAAPIRRPHLPPPEPCRRPHRPGTDAHRPG